MATLTTTVDNTLPAWDNLSGTDAAFATNSATYVTDTQLGSMAGMPANTRINWGIAIGKSSGVSANDGSRVCDSTGTYTYGEITGQFLTSPLYWVNTSWQGAHGNNGTVTIELQLKSGDGNNINRFSNLIYTNITYVKQDPANAARVHPRIFIVSGIPNFATNATNGGVFKIPLKFNISEISFGFIASAHMSHADQNHGLTVAGAKAYTCGFSAKSPTNQPSWRMNDGVRGTVCKAVTDDLSNVVTDCINVINKGTIDVWVTGSGGNSYPAHSQFLMDQSYNYHIVAVSGTQVELT